ncbi:TPA: hypothetical protein ACWXAB_005435, partial [Klebsiella pneumoniae]
NDINTTSAPDTKPYFSDDLHFGVRMLVRNAPFWRNTSSSISLTPCSGWDSMLIAPEPPSTRV